MNATTFHQGRHLIEAELLPESGACPVCGKNAARPALLLIQESPRVELRGCAACGAASASRMPRPEVLDRYYGGYYDGREERVTVGDAGRFGAAIARRLSPPRGGAPVRVLDFGGGDGSLALEVCRSLAARSGGVFDVTVVDYAPPSARLVPGVTLRSTPRLEEVEGSFEIVIASAVLEHVPELHDLAERLFSRVAPGGWFYARTPYVAPLARLVGRLDLTYPAHVHDLGPGFWNRVVDTFALRARLVRSAPSPVEASLRSHPLRAVLAHALKLPGFVESRWMGPTRRDPLWKWVGGWEAVLRFEPAACFAGHETATGERD